MECGVSAGAARAAGDNIGRVQRIIPEGEISDVVGISAGINAATNAAHGLDYNGAMKPRLYTAEELRAIGYSYSMGIGRDHYVFSKTDSSEQAIVKFIDGNGNGSGYAICEVIDGKKTDIGILRKYMHDSHETGW